MHTFQDPSVSGMFYSRLIVVSLDGLEQPAQFLRPQLFIGDQQLQTDCRVYGNAVELTASLDDPFFDTEDRGEALRRFQRRGEIPFRLTWQTTHGRQHSLGFCLNPETVQAEEDPWLFRRPSFIEC